VEQLFLFLHLAVEVVGVILLLVLLDQLVHQAVEEIKLTQELVEAVLLVKVMLEALEIHLLLWAVEAAVLVL
jgi:hypothetical protein